MKSIANKLSNAISENESWLKQLPEKQAGMKPSAKKWSKKEILGHLIDSAANNHQRIVRALYHAAEQFPPYDQNKWVEQQHYQELNWADLLEFWLAYNSHLTHLIALIPTEAESRPCNIGKENPVTLQFVVEDYLRHLEHHLEQLKSR